MQEIESLLNSERSKSKDLATKLYQTQAELNLVRTQGPLTPLHPNRLNFETTTPTSYTKLTSQMQSLHRQVHYFYKFLRS